MLSQASAIKKKTFKKYSQQGLSLVELLVAMAVSLIIIAGMISVTVSSMQRSRENLQIMRLDQEMRAAMDIMISNIQRAGYWRDAPGDTLQNRNLNPFMAVATDLNTASANCILFSYDRNNDGMLPALNSGTDDERYGYRLRTGVIQSRPASAIFDCAAATDTWADLTDINTVNISALQFSTVPATGYQTISAGGTATVTVRQVQITMTGNLVNDTATRRTLTESVRVRNDKYTA